MDCISLSKREKRAFRAISRWGIDSVSESDASAIPALVSNGLITITKQDGEDEAILTEKGKEYLRANPHLYNWSITRKVVASIENALAFIAIEMFGHSISNKRINMTKEELQTHIDAICKQNCFDYAKYLGKFNGDDIYEPTFYEEGTLFGRPVFIHVRGNRIRRSVSHAEASKVLHYFYDGK